MVKLAFTLHGMRDLRFFSLLFIFLLVPFSPIFGSASDAQHSHFSGAPTSQVSAKGAVEHAIQVMGGMPVLQQIRSFETHEIHSTYRLTDSDHPDGPFLVEPTEVSRFTDILQQHAVIQMDVRIPSGDRQISTVIYRGPESETRSEWNGKPSPTQLMPSPQNWSLGSPLIALQAALLANDLRTVGTSHLYGAPHTLVRFTHDGQPITLELNDYNGYADSITRQICTPSSIAASVWGDYQLKGMFGDWRLQKGGLHYPFLAAIYFNGVLQETDITQDLEINPASGPAAEIAASPVDANAVQNPKSVDDIPLSDLSTRANGNPGTGPVEIFPGVLQIPGNWYTTVVRQPDGLVIIDAPISSGYSRQVIAASKQHFPGVPIKALITSTSYWWHFAGIREYAAQGVPIYVLDANEPLIRAALKAPHTSHPDDLAKLKLSWKLIPISKPTMIGSGSNKLMLYPVRNATGQMMMTWFPDSHLLYTAEMAQPLGPNHTFLFPQSLWELMESVKSNQLPVEKIIGMHMSPTQWSLLVKTVYAAVAGEPPPKLHD